jgi:hypothetical protein
MKNHQPRLRVVACVLLNKNSVPSGFASRIRNGFSNSNRETGRITAVGFDKVRTGCR